MLIKKKVDPDSSGSTGQSLADFYYDESRIGALD
jgi:hypothetical protein